MGLKLTSPPLSFFYRFVRFTVSIATSFSPSTSVFPCQYHSTIAPYSFIHLPPTLYNVFLPVLQFPLSVSFHHCSILIRPSTTFAVCLKLPRFLVHSCRNVECYRVICECGQLHWCTGHINSFFLHCYCLFVSPNESCNISCLNI